MKNSFTYVASPYSHADKAVVSARHDITMAYVAHLLWTKKMVFSPIVHCHPTAEFAQIAGHFAFWRDYNFMFIRNASKLVVLDLPGWQNSKGVREEMAYAEGLGLSVKHISFEDIRDTVSRYLGTAYNVTRSLRLVADSERKPAVIDPTTLNGSAVGKPSLIDQINASMKNERTEKEYNEESLSKSLENELQPGNLTS